LTKDSRTGRLARHSNPGVARMASVTGSHPLRAPAVTASHREASRASASYKTTPDTTEGRAARTSHRELRGVREKPTVGR
jgi:hypothetical protein